MRVAAPIVLVGVCAVLATLWVGDGTSMERSEEAPKVFATERGQRSMLRLGDGTLARLNAASTLTVSPSFGTERRSVQLEGEAYFEVAHDARRPFIVQTRGATARVLGTTFDVSAYPDDDQVRVVVTDGTVEVEAEAFNEDRDEAVREAADERVEDEAGEAKSSAQRVVLTARQMATLEAPGRLSRHQAEDVERYLAWMDGELYFQDASFREVARSVERWYNIEIFTDESAIPPGHLNARFAENEPLSEVLNVIAATFGLGYERDAKTVRFYPTNASSLE
jgi:ferric-dicitrate binding protein FerR (iron transport regulator)